jgi:hypothetical protein
MSQYRRVSAWIKALAAAAALPLLAAAAPPPPGADPAELSLDQRIQKLKESALDITWREEAIEKQFLFPAGTRISVYVGDTVTGMLLKQISVSIDNSAPVHYEYSELESIVLQEQGLHKIVSINASPGTHSIHADFTAQYADAQPQDLPFSGRFDGSFDKTAQPAQLELDLVRDSYQGKPALKFREWRAEQ